MPITVTRARAGWHEPTTVPFKGEPLQIQIKRLTLAEKVEFRLDFQAYQRSTRRGPPTRQPGEEQLSEDEVWTRRLLESADARLKDRERALELNRESLAFIQHTFAHYVRVCPGALLETETGAAIVEGSDLYEVGQDDERLLGSVIVAVFVANEVSEDLKKKLPSPFDLMRSSPGNGDSAPSGDALDATAASAEPPASVPSVAVTGVNGAGPSGSIGTW